MHQTKPMKFQRKFTGGEKVRDLVSIFDRSPLRVSLSLRNEATLSKLYWNSGKPIIGLCPAQNWCIWSTHLREPCHVEGPAKNKPS